MKRSSDELFRLIKSLTKSEKGYFKKFAKRNTSGDNTSIKLFDSIDKQAEASYYDEEAVKKKFEGETFVKQLPVAKIYLYNLILKSLNLYYAETSAVSQIHELIDNVVILQQKGLFDQCKKLLKKAKALASENLYDFLMLEILRVEKHVDLHTLWGKKRYEKVKEYHEKEIKLLNEIRTHTEYMTLSSQISSLIDAKGVKREEKEEEIEKIMRSPYMQDENRADTFKSKVLFYNLYVHYYSRKKDHQKTYEYIKKQLELIETTPGAIQLSLRDYIMTLQDGIFWGYLSGHTGEALELMERLKKFKLKLAKTTDKILLTLFHGRAANLELAILINERRFDEGLRLVTEIEKEPEKYGNLAKEDTLSLFYKIAQFYYLTGEHEKALERINKLLNDARDDTRADMYCFLRILNLLVHLELGNNELLEYIIKSTYRYLQSHKKLYKVETLFMNLIKQLITAVGKADTAEAYNEFHFKLKKIKDLPSESGAFEYFDFLSWAESKITGKPMAEIRSQFMIMD